LRVWWGKLFSEKTSSGLNKIPDKPCSGLTRGPCISKQKHIEPTNYKEFLKIKPEKNKLKIFQNIKL
jgi:hypothetical protein